MWSSSLFLYPVLWLSWPARPLPMKSPPTVGSRSEDEASDDSEQSCSEGRLVNDSFTAANHFLPSLLHSFYHDELTSEILSRKSYAYPNQRSPVIILYTFNCELYISCTLLLTFCCAHSKYQNSIISSSPFNGMTPLSKKTQQKADKIAHSTLDQVWRPEHTVRLVYK